MQTAKAEKPPVQIQAQLARPADPEELDAWYKEHGLQPDKDGIFAEMPYGAAPVSRDDILQQVSTNALRHDVPNLHPREYTPKIMVYVGGGPTLRDHLEEVKRKCEDENYDVYTSNATCKFLLAKGIKPNFHLILDPTERKVKDLDYEEDVPLILGLQCHPKLFDRAKEKGVQVHKFLAASVTGEDGKSDKDAAKAALTKDDHHLMGIGGGSMCGTRMIYYAVAMGYRRLEYYGVDGSVEVKDGNIVKCYAYTKPRGENILETETGNGRKFFTTMSLARQGEELVLLLDLMPGLDVEIYGDSLMSNQLKIYKELRRKEPWCITPEYLEMQRKMHGDYGDGYGRSGHEHAPRVFMAAAQVLRKIGKCRVLDYGAGKGVLQQAIKNAFPEVEGITYHEYDPCVPGIDSPPGKAEVVFCGDVMEHVEPECIDTVLRHIRDLTQQVAIFVISLREAGKTLPDGRNAHISLHGADWWRSYLKKYFILAECAHDPIHQELIAVCVKLP
jgi:hypothetical protein